MADSHNSAHERRAAVRGYIVFALVLFGAMALAWRLRALLLLLYAAGLFAVLVDPVVKRLERRGLSRGAAIAAVIVSAVLASLLLARLVVPVLLAESSGLSARWPRASAGAVAELQSNPWLKRLPLPQLAPSLTFAGNWMLGFAGDLAGFFADAFMVLLLTIYMLAEGRAALAWSLGWMPTDQRGRLAGTLARGARRMRGWLVGQLLLAGIMGTAAAIVFAALRLPNFFLLALLLGALTFIPILGPVTGVIVAAAVAATQSWGKVAGVLIFYGAHQIVDNALLTPRVMRRAAQLPGLAVILALAAGATLGGALGALLAIPTAALTAELAAEYGGRR